MPNKTGRPSPEINWPLCENLIKLHANVLYISKQLKVSSNTLLKAIKKKYGVEYVQFKKSLQEEAVGLLISKAWTKAMQGNEKWMFHILKFYCGHNDFDLHKQTDKKYESEGDEKRVSTMDQLVQNSAKLVSKNGPVAEPVEDSD